MFLNLHGEELKINHTKQEEIVREDKEKQAQTSLLSFPQTKEQQYYFYNQQKIKTEDCTPIVYKYEYAQERPPYLRQKCHQVSSEEQITSSLMKPKKTPEDQEESENQQGGTYSNIQTELSISSRRQSIFKAGSIKKCLKVDGTNVQRRFSQTQDLVIADVQSQNINPIYSYKNYLATFLQPKSEKLIQYYEARVRSVSDPFTQQDNTNGLISGQQRRFSIPALSNANQPNTVHLNFIQSLSFQVDKKSTMCGNVLNFMKNYPISQILTQRDKKSKKLAGKIIQQTGGVSIGGFPIAVNDENAMEQYTQYSTHQQSMLNYIDIQSIIRNPKPGKSFSNLIEAQFFFFIIGDYKKLKRLQDHFQQNDDDQDKNNYKYTQNLAQDQYLFTLFADTDSSSLQSADSASDEKQDRKYNIDEFIAFKSQTTTSKLTKMQKSSFNNPFQDFSTHQKEKYNPNRNQFYNLPKYCMVFILELLSSKNLKRLGVAPEYQLLIQKIAKNVKKSAKIKEQKKKIMYNHNHYNCLFLTLNQQNTTEVSNQQDLKKLHMKVFGVENLLQPFDNLYINILKKIIERIIMIQLQLIQEFPLTQYIINNKNLYQFEKSKINYIERVIQGISKLREGEIIKRF